MNAVYLSDEKIKAQYEGFRAEITEIHQGWKDSYSGTIEIEFPNADHPDFNSSIVDNFISYDRDGSRIAFDNWFPEEVYKKLCEMIRHKANEVFGKP